MDGAIQSKISSTSGNVDSAISLLESIISNLESLGHFSSLSPSPDLRLATALVDLSDLESSSEFSIKADEPRTRALLVRTRAVGPPALKPWGSESVKVKGTPSREDEEIRVSETSNDRQQEDDGRNFEPFTGRSVAKWNPKKAGKRVFFCQKSCLYRDQHDVGTTNGDNPVAAEEVKVHDHRLEDADDHEWNLRYGTGRVLVLYDFSPSTRTGDLEKLFDKF